MFEPWREFDKLFGRLLPPPTGEAVFVPPVECYTRDKQIVLRAELPGVDPKMVEVAIAGTMLTIKGEKKEERKVEEESLYFREITRGRFERTFELPEGIKKEQIVATFQNGILEIVLPALALETARKVPIEIQEIGKKTIKAA